MWPFRKRARADSAPEPVAVADVLGSMMTRVFDSQAKMLEQNTAFLGAVQELGAKKAAQALGSRGGRKRAENAARKKTQAGCRLCKDAFSTNLTVEEVEAHRAHADLPVQ